MIKFCDYGCGQEAKFILKNGKQCCGSSHNMCPELKKHNPGNTGHKSSNEKKEKLRAYRKNIKMTQETKNKISKKLKNRKFSSTHIKNLKLATKKVKRKPWTEDQKLNLKPKRTGKNNSMYGRHHSENTKKIIGINSKKLKHSDKYKKQLKEYMLNGGHDYISSFIKKISKEEKQLQELVKQLYPFCICQYKVFRYEIDIAIPEYKIAIEFDGYYHFDTLEHMEYHKIRQQKIENEGWKFYRVTMFDKFPTLEEVKGKIDLLKG